MVKKRAPGEAIGRGVLAVLRHLREAVEQGVARDPDGRQAQPAVVDALQAHLVAAVLDLDALAAARRPRRGPGRGRRGRRAARRRRRAGRRRRRAGRAGRGCRSSPCGRPRPACAGRTPARPRRSGPACGCSGRRSRGRSRSCRSSRAGRACRCRAGSAAWCFSVPSRCTEPPNSPNCTPTLTSSDRSPWPSVWKPATRPPGSSAPPYSFGKLCAPEPVFATCAAPLQDEVAVGVALEAVGLLEAEPEQGLAGGLALGGVRPVEQGLQAPATSAVVSGSVDSGTTSAVMPRPCPLRTGGAVRAARSEQREQQRHHGQRRRPRRRGPRRARGRRAGSGGGGSSSRPARSSTPRSPAASPPSGVCARPDLVQRPRQRRRGRAGGRRGRRRAARRAARPRRTRSRTDAQPREGRAQGGERQHDEVVPLVDVGPLVGEHGLELRRPTAAAARPG